MIYDLIIIGGGAAGLFAAANAPSGKILLLEKTDSAGKKILISGGGMCNLTNCDEPDEFLGHFGSRKKANFLKPALYSFSPAMTGSWFESRGFPLLTREDGKVFPAGLKAQSLVNFLIREARKRGVEYRKDSAVSRIIPGEGLFEIHCGENRFQSRSVLLAAGGKSYPSTGSDGSAYALVRSLGHKIIDPTQALAPVYIESYNLASLSGSSLKDVPVDFFHSGENKAYLKSRGDFLFTHRGLSGPVILNNSRHIRADDIVDLCLISAENREVLREKLQKDWDGQGRRTVKVFLKSLGIFSALAEILMERSAIDPGAPCSAAGKKPRNRLFSLILHYSLTVSGKSSFASAMATAGGVDLEQVDRKTMESKIVPGLYFAGEILDIDGDTGGYNIQAAFSTALKAVRSFSEGTGREEKPV